MTEVEKSLRLRVNAASKAQKAMDYILDTQAMEEAA